MNKIFFYNRFTTLLTIIATLCLLILPYYPQNVNVMKAAFNSGDPVLISLAVSIILFAIAVIMLVMGQAIIYVFTGKVIKNGK